MSEVRSFITHIGQVIGKFKSEDATSIELDEAIGVVLSQGNKQNEIIVGLQPILPNILAKADPKGGIWIKLNKSAITEFKLVDKLINEYNQLMSNIEIAPASVITDLNSRRPVK